MIDRFHRVNVIVFVGQGAGNGLIICPLSALCFLFEIMKIKINDTLTFEAAAVVDNLTDESREQVRAAVLQQFGRFEDITLADFISYTNGDYTPAGIDREHPENMTVGQYVWLLEFRKFVDLFNKINSGLAVPETADAKKARKGQKPMTFAEYLLVFCREYFGFHTFDEAAERLTVSDYLTAAKDRYNDAIFKRNMARIEQEKLKQQQRRKL